MCGIGGFVDWANTMSQAQKRNVLHVMQKSLKHRGPDAQGMYLAKQAPIGLMHTRLSIVDLSDTGSQPMHQKELGTHLVFNGEIYNHHELRSSLLEEGATLNGTSDTEVLLNWLSLTGIQKMNLIDGMFAFCLYDERKQTLI